MYVSPLCLVEEEKIKLKWLVLQISSFLLAYNVHNFMKKHIILQKNIQNLHTQRILQTINIMNQILPNNV